MDNPREVIVPLVIGHNEEQGCIFLQATQHNRELLTIDVPNGGSRRFLKVRTQDLRNALDQVMK